MHLRFTRKVVWKSEQRLTQWYQTRRNKTDALIRAFRDSLIVYAADVDPALKVSSLETAFVAQGGHKALMQGCDEHLRHEKQNWRPFARAVFIPIRSALLRLAGILPLQGSPTSTEMLRLVSALTCESSLSDYLTVDGALAHTLPREWQELVHDHATDKQAFNRRQLEVAVMLELAVVIKAGEVFVSGSSSFDRFWDRLPTEAADPATVAAYATARGWPDGADGLLRALKFALERKAQYLDVAVGSGQQAYLRKGRHGRPVVTRLSAAGTPETAIDLETQLMAHMPERAVLEAISKCRKLGKVGAALRAPVPARSPDQGRPSPLRAHHLLKSTI